MRPAPAIFPSSNSFDRPLTGGLARYNLSNSTEISEDTDERADGSDVWETLAGQIAGKKTLRQALRSFKQRAARHHRFPRLQGCRNRHGSWVNAVFSPFFQWAGDEQIDLFPVICNLADKKWVDEFALVAEWTHRCFLIANGPIPAEEGKAVGPLDPGQKTTLEAMIEFGPVTVLNWNAMESRNHQGNGLEQSPARFVRQATHSPRASRAGASLLNGVEGDRVQWVTISQAASSELQKKAGQGARRLSKPTLFTAPEALDRTYPCLKSMVHCHAGRRTARRAVTHAGPSRNRARHASCRLCRR